MAPKIEIYRSGKLICETRGAQGGSLLQSIAGAGVFLDAPCGGGGRCGKCLVRLSPDGGQVRACRTKIDGDMEVHLPEEADMQITGDACPAELSPPAMPHAPAVCHLTTKLGVAVDIGTTTVVAHLTDIGTGARIATASGVNVQRQYGADVISRIQYCADNGHETLTQLIRDQLASLIRHTCAISDEHARSIGYVSIAGNTIMQHLAAGYSPVNMGAAPFKPVSLFGEELPAWQGLPAARSAKVYFAPAVSSYVGGDVTAGMLAAGLEDTQGPAIYLDIGTNGEIALKSGGDYYCCAVAAGPAFEGAEITKGMAAVNGAITRVEWENGLKLSVIGEKIPRGICGSGLLDALALLLETGAVDGTGRLNSPDEINHEIARHIEIIDGKNIFRLTNGADSVYITAADIRKLQLAKSAIAAGIQTVLRHTGASEGQVESFVLAGGFGSFMDKHNAARIGLFPKSFLAVAQTPGNTAGEGASLALRSESARAELEGIRKRCNYIELSTNPIFNEQFIEQMAF